MGSEEELELQGGLQQSTDPTNQLGSLADSMFKLAEFEYIARSSASAPRGTIVSGDGPIIVAASDTEMPMASASIRRSAAAITLFARYGNGEVGDIPGKEHFYSGGVEFGAPHTFASERFLGHRPRTYRFRAGPEREARGGVLQSAPHGSPACRRSCSSTSTSRRMGPGYFLPGRSLSGRLLNGTGEHHA